MVVLFKISQPSLPIMTSSSILTPPQPAGWGGVRIEDDVIIGKEGCEILNKTTKDLIVLN